MNVAPVLCGKDSCRYENECVAEKSGFDPNSCVPDPAPVPDPFGGTMFPTATPPKVGVANDGGGGGTPTPSGGNSLGVAIGLFVSTTAAVIGMIML